MEGDRFSLFSRGVLLVLTSMTVQQDVEHPTIQPRVKRPHCADSAEKEAPV